MFGDMSVSAGKAGGPAKLWKALTPLTFYLTMVEDRPQLEHPMNPFI
jgi:hypothetical protein